MKYFLPQFAAQAAVHLEAAPRPSTPPSYAAGMKYVSAMIRSGVHIVLPDNGEIYRGNYCGGDKPSEDELLSLEGLPAPVTVFEYRYTHSLDEREIWLGHVSCRKRLIVAIDGKQVGGEQDKYFITLFQVLYSEEHRLWLLHPTALQLQAPIICRMVGDQYAYYCTMRDLMRDKYYSPGDPEATDIMADFYTEITAAIQCCHALRAGARLEEQHERSPTRRRKFEKKGVGGFTYHVLKLPGSGGTQTGEGGSHASPRLHVRRAHIRKLPTGALTFVRQCFVGDPERGRVDKHYQVGMK